MNIQSLEVNDYVYFKKASLDFSTPGISLILANNKDAGLNSTNGAGKSLLLGAIPKALLDESPTGKDIKPTKTETIEIVFKNKKDLYKVLWATGSSKTISIFKNGESVENRTLAYSKSFIKKLTGGMTPETFYTQIYLDSTIPHPLLFPNAKLRQDFFVNLFGINNADNIRKLLLSQYRECQDNVSKYKELKTLLDEEFEDDIDTLKDQLTKLLSKQKRFISEASAATSHNDSVRFYKKNTDIITLWKSIKKAESLSELIDNLRQVLRDQESLKSERVLLEAYTRDYKTVVKKNKKTQDELDELSVDADEALDLDLFVARYDKAADALYSFTKDFSKLAKIDKPVRVEKPEYFDKTAEISRELEFNKDSLQHLLEFKKGVCPTCGQHVKQVTSKEDLIKRVSALEKKLTTLSKYSRYLENIAKYDSYTEASRELDENIVLCQTRCKKYVKYSTFKNLRNLLKPFPTKPSVSKESFDETLYETTKSDLENHIRLNQVIDKVKECLQLETFEIIDTEDLASKLADVNEKLGRISAEISRKEEIVKQRKRITTKLSVFSKSLEDEKIIKVLVDVYSKKGIKKVLINNYAKLLETQVNKFSKLFYTEDYKFEFNYDTKLNLLVTRRHGSKTRTSDVAKLSGAEKRAFTLVLLMSTITFLPKHKRSNLLILDEPESNLGPLALENFIKSLPVLNKLIPHIVILTPRADLEIPNSNVLTVIKQSGKSILKKGRH
jgi:DNA repair exonuclease SbcCD ATPase subunit